MIFQGIIWRSIVWFVFTLMITVKPQDNDKFLQDIQTGRMRMGNTWQYHVCKAAQSDMLKKKK